MAPKAMFKFAKELGWQVEKGAKHYRLFHPVTGQTTILPYGTHFSSRTERRILRRLKQGSVHNADAKKLPVS